LRVPNRRLIKVEVSRRKKHPYSPLHKCRSGFLKGESYEKSVWLIEGSGNPEKEKGLQSTVGSRRER
jgi:hypothetical protein